MSESEIMLRALTAAHPVPENLFEKALWLSEMRSSCATLEGVLDREYRMTIERILDTHAEDEVYEILPVVKTERSIDTDVLREEDPEMYEQLAFISAATAGKALGKKGLRAAMAEKFGEENLHRFESVNVKDVEAIYDPEEWHNFIRDTRVPDGYEIVKKGEEREPQARSCEPGASCCDEVTQRCTPGRCSTSEGLATAAADGGDA